MRRLGIAEGSAIVVLAFLLLCALAPSLVAPGDPRAIAPGEAFLPPSGSHWLGTDESGRDLFGRIVHGAGASLVIGISATGVGIALGLVLGTAAGLGPRWLDFGTSRAMEVLFAFPGLLLALLFIAIAGPGVVTSTIAVGLATAPGYGRLIRSRLVSLRSAPYVESAVVLGRSATVVFTNTLLPGVVRTLFVLATLGIGQSVVWASSLSYLGLGVPPPAAEWGALLNAGRVYLDVAWWLSFFPGLAIVATAASATILGRSWQRRLSES